MDLIDAAAIPAPDGRPPKPKKLVKRYFKRRRKVWRAGSVHDRELLVYAGLASLAAATLFLTSGYHAAFFALHDTGRVLFSQGTWANITFMGDTVSALAVAALFSYRYPHLVVATFASAIVCTALVHLMKYGFDASRPPAVLPPEILEVIGPAYKRNSFPSGHTATAFVMCGLLTRTATRFVNRLALIVAASLVAWSRVAVGVHWPVDVLVGAAIGLFSAWAGLRLTDGIEMRVRHYTALMVVLLACCGYLAIHDGGFEATAHTAPLLGASALGLWVVNWGDFFLRARQRWLLKAARRVSRNSGASDK